jgi:predicted dehydrogenase
MKTLVIGYGSIGQRHAANLTRLDHEVVLLRHASGGTPNGIYPEYHDFEQAVEVERPELAVIASPTPRHAEDALRLIERRVPFLLEKPPALDLHATLALEAAIEESRFNRYDLAFNLRYYPPVRFIKEFLPELGRIFSMRVAAGYHLPAWRPGVDYRQTTSARKELGGGVHIELVHEVDYLLWFMGMPARVVAHVATVGNLEISSADSCTAMLVYPDGAGVELHLDYLSHKNLRGCQIIAEHGTLEWSFTEKRVSLFEPGNPAAREIFQLSADYDFNQTYIEELQHMVQVAHGKAAPSIDMAHGVRVMKILDAMIESSASEKWINISEDNKGDKAT